MKKGTILIAIILLLMAPAATLAVQKSLVQVSIDGSILFFSDGSKYRVERYDLSNSLKWRDRDRCDVLGAYRNEWVWVPIKNVADGTTVYALRIQ